MGIPVNGYNPWVGIFIVLSSLIGLLGLCHYFGGKTGLSPELKRKGVHIGMGLLCTAFPSLFTDIWPVVLLAGTAVISLFVIRMLPSLRKSVGSSLHEVERTSLGEIFFPLAVLTVWFVSYDRPLFYSLSILVLTLADASAALIGTKYGQQHYSTREGYKTLEGSFFFFTVTFLCIHIPLLLLSDIGRAESLLLAVLIGIVMMVIEAVAWKGLDNLFIPICVCVLLNIYTEYSAGQLLFRVGLLISVITGFFILRNRLNLDDASLLGSGLIAYCIYTIGGWEWMLAPIAVLLNYLYLVSDSKAEEGKVHDIYALLAVAAPAFFWLLLFYRYGGEEYLFLHNVSYMAELICMYIAHWAFKYQEKSLSTISLQSGVLGFGMIVIPYFILHYEKSSWKLLAICLIVALLCSQVFRFSQPQIRDCPLTSDRFIRQGLVGMSASGICWLIL